MHMQVLKPLLQLMTSNSTVTLISIGSFQYYKNLARDQADCEKLCMHA